MTEYIIGLLLFFGVHSVGIVSDNWRNAMAQRMGEWTWKGVYGLVAIIGLVLIIHGYGPASQQDKLVYTLPSWLYPFSLVLLLPVFPLLAAAYLPGRIQQATRHPMLLATLLWALAHLLVNGNLTNVLLFGVFLLWAVIDLVSLQRRSDHPPPRLPATAVNDILAILAGLAIYGLFAFWLHQELFGVAVLRPA